MMLAARQLGTVPGCPGQKGQLGPGTPCTCDAGSGTTGDRPRLSGTEGTTQTWDSMHV